ncbi:MAG: UPF0261 family protein [Actinobacteria bacterium]|nr:UPF0261 family protein [Actinomycetota bacterium]
MPKTILIIATLDTKAQEVRFLKESIRNKGHNTLIVDAGVFGVSGIKANVTNQQVALAAGAELEKVLKSKDKGKCIAHMIKGAAKTVESLFRQNNFAGIIGIGGAQGAAIGTACMRALPFGLPKLMLTTVASGRACFGEFVGTADLTIMHSVVDIFGLNGFSRKILENAAGAIVGMVEADSTIPSSGKPAVAMTVLGNTTPAGIQIKRLLEQKGYEVIGFHANGTGGVAMEQLMTEGRFDAVLDLTTHEIIDREFGGLHASLSGNRLTAAAELGIPQLVVPGCIDYLVFGPPETIPARFKNRPYVVHNPQLTLVRANGDEMVHVARIMVERINRSKGPAAVVVPTKGLSMHNIEGQAFFDPKADSACLDVYRKELRPDIHLHCIEAHINDPVFAERGVHILMDLCPVGLAEKP